MPISTIGELGITVFMGGEFEHFFCHFGKSFKETGQTKLLFTLIKMYLLNVFHSRFYLK